MNNLIEAVAAKVAFRYSKILGDRIRVTHEFLKDKAGLKPSNRSDLENWFKKWYASQNNINTPGGLAAFESKGRDSKKGMNVYVVEVHKQNPSIHMIVYITKTSAITTKKGIELKGDQNFFIFDRIFDDYKKYYDYLTSVIRTK